MILFYLCTILFGLLAMFGLYILIGVFADLDAFLSEIKDGE